MRTKLTLDDKRERWCNFINQILVGTRQIIAIDFNKRQKGKEVKKNTISHILKNSSRILEDGDNLKELKRERAKVSGA